MNLSALRNFVTTAEMLNFRKAAESEFISQPALSRRIAGLERELGVQLFERGGRGVQLTEAGRVLLDQARQLLEKADQTVAAVRGITPTQRTDVSVGLSGSAGACLIADLLCRLRALAPDVTVDVRTGDWPAHLEQLADGSLDVAFGYLPQSLDRGCDAMPLWELEVGMLVHRSHATAGPGRAAIGAFSTDRIMIPSRQLGDGYRNRLVNFCTAAGFEPSIDERPTGCSDTVAAVQVAVATGHGVGFVPRGAIAELPPNTTLVRLSPAPPPCLVGLAWRRQNRSSIVDALLDLAKAHGAPPALAFPDAPNPALVAA
jgi:DNA-binding transcriptional LysR family regulator